MKKINSLLLIIMAVIFTGCGLGMKELADKLTMVPGALVIYDANLADRGSAPEDENKYKAGFLVTVLDNTGNLERDNSYYFTGWNTAADGTGTTYIPGQTISIGTGDITLYARWRQGTFYTVIYNANGGLGTLPAGTTYYESGTTVYVKNSGTLSMAGYSFAGWNTSTSGTGTNYTAGDSFTINGETTLYAKWEGGQTYTVTYDANYPANAAGDTGGSVPVDDTNYTPGSSVNVPVNTGNLYCQGYTFGGWSNGAATYDNLPAVITMGNSNIVLRAKWNTCNYTVTFINGIEFFASININSPAYSIGASMPGNPPNAGYNFKGWYTSQNGGGTQYFADTEVTVNTTLYSLWDGTIIFNKNGADATGSMDNITIIYGYTAALTACAYSRPGWYFGGWNTSADGSGTAYTESAPYTMNTGNTTLYAQWGHMVYYNLNNGAGVVPVDSAVYIRGKTVTVKGLSGSGLTGSGGGSFICWNTDSGGSGTRYNMGDTFTMWSSDVVLYAQYNSSAYQLGDTGPGGGKIFYIAADYSAGWKYMEAWTADLGQVELMLFGCDGTFSSDIGQGYENTVALYEADNYAPDTALYLCRNLGYSWFLPSVNELAEMYTNRAYIGTFTQGEYWSSSSFWDWFYMGHSRVWGQFSYVIDFTSGTQTRNVREALNYVRPVRRF